MKKTFFVLSILMGILTSSYGTVQSIEKIEDRERIIVLKGNFDRLSMSRDNFRNLSFNSFENPVEAYIKGDILTVCFNIPLYGNTLTISIDDEQGKVIFEQDFIVFEPNLVHIQVNRNETRTYTLHITNPEFCDLYGDF